MLILVRGKCDSYCNDIIQIYFMINHMKTSTQRQWELSIRMALPVNQFHLLPSANSLLTHVDHWCISLVKRYKRHGVADLWHLDCLFNGLFGQHRKTSADSIFVIGIELRLVDSTYKQWRRDVSMSLCQHVLPIIKACHYPIIYNRAQYLQPYLPYVRPCIRYTSSPLFIYHSTRELVVIEDIWDHLKL